MGYERLVTGR